MVNWNILSNRNIRKNILSHITRNHQGHFVESVEKKDNAYKVTFMNGISLIFDRHGKFVKGSINE